jgi:hypothetical protein
MLSLLSIIYHYFKNHLLVFMSYNSIESSDLFLCLKDSATIRPRHPLFHSTWLNVLRAVVQGSSHLKTFNLTAVILFAEARVSALDGLFPLIRYQLKHIGVVEKVVSSFKSLTDVTKSADVTLMFTLAVHCVLTTSSPENAGVILVYVNQLIELLLLNNTENLVENSIVWEHATEKLDLCPTPTNSQIIQLGLLPLVSELILDCLLDDYEQPDKIAAILDTVFKTKTISLSSIRVRCPQKQQGMHKGRKDAYCRAQIALEQRSVLLAGTAVTSDTVGVARVLNRHRLLSLQSAGYSGVGTADEHFLDARVDWMNPLVAMNHMSGAQHQHFIQSLSASFSGERCALERSLRSLTQVGSSIGSLFTKTLTSVLQERSGSKKFKFDDNASIQLFLQEVISFAVFSMTDTWLKENNNDPKQNQIIIPISNVAPSLTELVHSYAVCSSADYLELSLMVEVHRSNKIVYSSTIENSFGDFSAYLDFINTHVS